MNTPGALQLLSAPLSETLPRLSEILAPTVPHVVMAQLAANCPFAPFKTVGSSPGLFGAPITAADLGRIRTSRAEGESWQGYARIAGTDVPILALMSDESDQESLLVLVKADGSRVSDDAVENAQGLWDVVTAHREGLRNEAAPEWLALSRAASAARALAIAELADAHGAALSAMLDTLRNRGLNDTEARSRALDLAVSELAELRSRAQLDQSLAEERAGHAYESLKRSLMRVTRPRGVHLECAPLGIPDTADVLLSADVTSTARAVVRAIANTMLEEQPKLTRIHVSWKITDEELRATVRDDGPGALDRNKLSSRRVQDRLNALRATLAIEAIPGWGTTVTTSIPLGSSDLPRQDPLASLRPREVEVLNYLAQGHRNRDIAAQMHISESTVKFHVAKIFDKLSITSRGEAAAIAHSIASPRAN